MTCECHVGLGTVGFFFGAGLVQPKEKPKIAFVSNQEISIREETRFQCSNCCNYVFWKLSRSFQFKSCSFIVRGTVHLSNSWKLRQLFALLNFVINYIYVKCSICVWWVTISCRQLLLSVTCSHWNWIEHVLFDHSCRSPTIKNGQADVTNADTWEWERSSEHKELKRPPIKRSAIAVLSTVRRGASKKTGAVEARDDSGLGFECSLKPGMKKLVCSFLIGWTYPNFRMFKTQFQLTSHS